MLHGVGVQVPPPAPSSSADISIDRIIDIEDGNFLMQVNETLNEGLKRTLEMRIPAAELSKKLDDKLNELKSTVNLKGFRPGKVPFAHMKKTYGRSVMGDVMQDAINVGVQSTLEERKEKAAMQPTIDLPEDEAILTKVFEGEADLEFSMSYEVLPEVKLGDFKKIKIDRNSRCK